MAKAKEKIDLAKSLSIVKDFLITGYISDLSEVEANNLAQKHFEIIESECAKFKPKTKKIAMPKGFDDDELRAIVHNTKDFLTCFDNLYFDINCSNEHKEKLEQLNNNYVWQQISQEDLEVEIRNIKGLYKPKYANDMVSVTKAKFILVKTHSRLREQRNRGQHNFEINSALVVDRAKQMLFWLSHSDWFRAKFNLSYIESTFESAAREANLVKQKFSNNAEFLIQNSIYGNLQHT